MPLTKVEKDYIVDKVTEILKSPDKKARLDALREQVMGGEDGEGESLDAAAYSVLQAIEELYG